MVSGVRRDADRGGSHLWFVGGGFGEKDDRLGDSVSTIVEEKKG